MRKLRYIILLLMTALSLIVYAQTTQAPTGYAQATQNAVNVGVMLPLHDNDGDGRRIIEYYRGVLMAVNKLKQQGMNINVRAWNLSIDADPRVTLLQEGATDCNVIFGPLYSKQVQQLGDFCKAYNIKLVIPFSITGDHVDKNPQIFQVYQSVDDMNTATIQHVVEDFSNYHLVFIDCNDTTSKKGTFTFALRRILEKKGVVYNLTNLRSSEQMFAKSFSLTQPNLVILNTGRSPELTQAMNKLDQLLLANRDVDISLFGYTEWLMYAKYNKEKFAKYNTYIPTNFYYNEGSQVIKDFEQRYRWAFHQDMSYALPHFAATGYDHAMFFIGNATSWLQTPLKFYKQGNGGYRNKTFMLIHYKRDGGIDALNY